MSSHKVIPRVLNLNSGRSNIMKQILEPLSKGHHQIGVTAMTLSKSNSQAGSLAPSRSFFIRRMVKLGLVTYPQKCLPFTCDVSRPLTYSSIAGETQPVESAKSQVDFDVTKQRIGKKTTNKPISYIYLQSLLRIRPQNQDVQRIKKAIKELDEIGFKNYNEQMTLYLMQFYCNQGNVEKAMHFKELLPAEFPADRRLISLATLLVSRGQFDEAVNLISKFSPNSPIKEKGKGLFPYVLNLLTAIEKTGDLERARKMLDLLIKMGYYRENPPNSHIGILVKIHLEKNDIDSAVKEFMQAVEKYSCTPCLIMILKALYEKSETDKLQEVLNTAGKIHGESNVLMDLAKAFLELNNLTKALTIMKTPGILIRDGKLHYMLEAAVLDKKVEMLEEFVKGTADLADINRDIVYYYLLRVYVLEENVEKALEAWSNMQKEGVEPSQYTLHLLGNFLTQMGQPVPFSFPRIVGKYYTKDDIGKEDGVETTEPKGMDKKSKEYHVMSQQLESFINTGKLADAKTVCDDMISGNIVPSPRILEKFFLKLSDVSDVDTLSSLEQQLPASVFKSSKLYSYRFIAKMNLGQYEEVMRDIEEIVPRTEVMLPGRAFMILLSKRPDSFDRLSRVADLHHQAGDSFPRNLIWMWLMKNERFDEAKQILKSTPQLKFKLVFNQVLAEINLSRNEVLSKTLLEQVKSTKILAKVKGQAYSSHIDLLISLSKLDEALATFEESQKIVKLRDMFRPTLMALELELTKNGRPVPFTVPTVDDSSTRVRSTYDRGTAR